MYEILSTFFLSLSPMGEARAGIPFGVVQGLNVFSAFAIALTANLLVFPLFYRGIILGNKYLWKNRIYKKSAVYLIKRARRSTGKSIDKYGVWGLMLFVMIPLPITGAYIGTLAAHLYNIKYRQAFFAISLGITLSSLIIAIGTHIGLSFI